jgi:valyl-tRNA synthetase
LWDDGASVEAKRGTRSTLVRVLEAILRLLHPFMPFITEEIWQTVGPLAGKSGPTIMLQPYPVSDDKDIDKVANADIEWLKGVIVGIRNIRGEMNISPAIELTVLMKNGCEQDKNRLEQNRQFLKKLAKLDNIEWLAEGDEAPVSATALVDQLEILVPMAGLIDKEAELARLAKEIDKLNKDLARIRGKLGNASFVEKAPAEVVAKEQEKMHAQEQALTQLREQEQRIQHM